MALEKQKEEMTIRRKSDHSIVTEVDIAVQEMLMKSIRERYHVINFISEEDFDRNRDDIKDDTISAIIDPIDGTAMFSMRLPIWCVSVGIFRGYRPLYGFVYAPACNLFFYNDDECSYLNDEPVRIKKNLKIDSETNIFYASEIHNHYRIVFPGKVRNLGSTALQACLTIDNERNRTLAFIGKSFLWDWAGAIPVILKSGGTISTISGREIDFNEVVENRYRFTDFLVAHCCENFDMIGRFFHKLNP
jgi:fructose-1,6-bisphosphatase/inositol monophosphatase family enzyme